MTDTFNDYFFTSNSTDHVCPGFGSFQCEPPNACARDTSTGKRYCCDVGDVCWTITSTCETDGSTLDCGSGDTTWCCLENSEVCTESPGQINICWARAHDLLLNISSPTLNDTYSSLSSAKPKASSWSFDPQTLIAATQTTSSTTSKTTSSTTTPVPTTSVTPSPTTSPVPSSPSSMNGGAIAGIVIGALAGLTIISAAVWFLMRHRRKKGQNRPTQQGFSTAPIYLDDNKVQSQPQELGTEGLRSTSKTDQEYLLPQELSTRDIRSASRDNQEHLLPQELPADSPHHERSRLGS